MGEDSHHHETFEKLFETKLTDEQLEALRNIAPHHKEITKLSPETEILVIFAKRKRMVNTAWKVFGGWMVQVGKWMAIITASFALYSQIDTIFPNAGRHIGETIGTVLNWFAGNGGG